MTKLHVYQSLGTLIKEYRQWHRLSQEKLAANIGISARQLQNWENNHHSVRIDNLHDLAEATGIPMQVCVALNADQPVWYSLHERRASFSSIEAHYLSKEFLKYREISGNETFANSEQISKDKHISMILTCYSEILGSTKTLRKDVIKAAATILPDLNRIFFDSSGHYVGHSICLPLKKTVYQELKERTSFENFLTTEKISDIVGHQEGVFFYYSIFAISLNIAHQVATDMARFFGKIEQQKRYLFAFAASGDRDVKLVRNFGMAKVKDVKNGDADSFPQLYETTLDKLTDYLAAGQFSIKKHGRMAATKKSLTNQPKYVGQPSNLPTGTKHFPKEQAVKKLPVPDALTIGVRCAILPVVNSQAPLILNSKKQKLKDGTSDANRNAGDCPNPQCPQIGKPGESRIISYGTYRSKDGIPLPRFLCKNCGKSFCSKASTIFYGLRSPQDRVLEAFKLLARGMPLRGVAAALGIEFRTVQHWLNFAVKRSGTIDAPLKKALDVSQVELDALWASVKKGTLRERALLWKTSNASLATEVKS